MTPLAIALCNPQRNMLGWGHDMGALVTDGPSNRRGRHASPDRSLRMPALAARATMPRPGDTAIIAAFSNAIEQGHPIDTAATIAGIGAMTARDWITQGNAQLDADPDGARPVTELGSHAAFAAAHKQALAELVDAKLGQIHDAAASGPKFWPAAMTLIERRFPRDFGRNERLEIEQRSVNVNVTLEALPPGQREALIAALSRTPPQALLAGPSDTIDDIT